MALDVGSRLSDQSFVGPFEVAGRASIADLLRPGRRCGLYVLGFGNRDFYVGQAVDATRRYVQHRLTRPDIVALWFKRLARGALDEAERALVEALEASGAPLRNIALMAMPPGERDIDFVIPREEAEAWVRGGEVPAVPGEARPTQAGARRRSADRFEAFRGRYLTPALARLLEHYAGACLPAPARTEAAFWCVTCLARPIGEGWTLLGRVNAGWQEVLTLTSHPREGLWADFQIALSVMDAEGPRWQPGLLRRYATLGFADNVYRAGGADQVRVSAALLDAAFLLDDPVFREAARTQVYRLIRRGACPYSRSHCPQLADVMFGGAPQLSGA